MEQIISFLRTLALPAPCKWNGNRFMTSRFNDSQSKFIESYFDIETKNYHYLDLNPESSNKKNRIHSDKDEKELTFLSIGMLKKPYAEDMPKLYIASHTTNSRIKICSFDWLLCYPNDKTISPFASVSSDSGPEKVLLSLTAHQVLSLISMLMLDLDYEEMRTGHYLPCVDFSNINKVPSSKENIYFNKIDGSRTMFLHSSEKTMKNRLNKS